MLNVQFRCGRAQILAIMPLLANPLKMLWKSQLQPVTPELKQPRVCGRTKITPCVIGSIFVIGDDLINHLSVGSIVLHCINVITVVGNPISVSFFTRIWFAIGLISDIVFSS